MRRSILNLAVDSVTLLALLSVAVTGLLLRWILPPGSRGGAGLSLWAWTRHDWGDLHFYLVTALGGLLVIHLALHWNWVCSLLRGMFVHAEHRNLSPRRFARTVYGVVTLAVLCGTVVVFLWFASNTVSRESRGEQERNRYGVRDGVMDDQTDLQVSEQEGGHGPGHRLRGTR